MSNAVTDSGERHDLPPRSARATSSKKVIWISSVAVIFALVFCASFVFFYSRYSRSKAAEPVNSGNLLPAADLVDESNQRLADSQLKNGMIVLVFVTPGCDACLKESEFLKELVAKRADVRFYGVISFGDMATSLREAKGEFPFQVFYDRGFRLANQLGIKKVPIKIFVDNGVIKKSWGGATVDDKKKADFIRWLDTV